MNKVIFALIVAGSSLALAACATQPKKDAAGRKTAQQDKQVCVSSIPIGSHIAQTRCMSLSEYKAKKKAPEQGAAPAALQAQRAGSGGG